MTTGLLPHKSRQNATKPEGTYMRASKEAKMVLGRTEAKEPGTLGSVLGTSRLGPPEGIYGGQVSIRTGQWMKSHRSAQSKTFGRWRIDFNDAAILLLKKERLLKGQVRQQPLNILVGEMGQSL